MSRESIARVSLLEYGGAGVHRRAGRGMDETLASGNIGVESARIDSVNGNVGAICRIRCGAQFRTIFLACLRDSARKLDHGFSARNRRKNVGKAFHGEQLLIGIEDVEFGFVGCECCAVICWMSYSPFCAAA